MRIRSGTGPAFYRHRAQSKFRFSIFSRGKGPFNSYDNPSHRKKKKLHIPVKNAIIKWFN